jgi:hypothetical protein
MKNPLRPFLLVVPVLLAACGGESAPARAAGLPASDLPEHYFLASTPAGAVDVGAARAGLEDGATVTVRGVVGGSVKPFVEGLAAFTIVDPALVSCAEDDMACKTPWDYCCIDPQTIAENSATVEFRESGATLSASPRGFHGLDRLSTVVVEGVAEKDAQGNVTIVASGVRTVDG